jgi:hypothetical protein
MVVYHDQACRPQSTHKLHRLTTDQLAPYHNGRIIKRRSTTHDQYMNPRFSHLVNLKYYKHPEEGIEFISDQNRAKRMLDLSTPQADHIRAKAIVDLSIQLIQHIFFLNQLRLRQRQYNRSSSHHIRTIMDSLKSEYAPDWLHVAPGQLWSFKLIEDTSNWLHARLDYHSVLKNESHDQSEQDVKDFYWIEENPVTYRQNISVCKTKIKDIGWYFHIEHITNPVT